MLTKHFLYCSSCKQKLQTIDSKNFGKCYSCRNYKKIELFRLNQWNNFWAEMDAMSQTNRFEIFQRKTVAMDLFKAKTHFIKTGYMIPPNKKSLDDRADSLAIMIAMRNPRIESSIQWVKFSKAGKEATVKETRHIRKMESV